MYERLLGNRLAELDPRLHRYFGSVPAGMVGVGRGRYELAGSRCRVLTPIFAWLARREILFPEFAHAVPFVVRNTPAADGTLSAVRTFEFDDVTRVMRDSMAVRDGILIDRLGRQGELEVTLQASVVNAEMRMTSTRLALRVGRVRVPLPPIARVSIREHADDVGQHVDVRLVAPLLGEFFRYAGTFTYHHVLLDHVLLDHVERSAP